MSVAKCELLVPVPKAKIRSWRNKTVKSSTTTTWRSLRRCFGTILVVRRDCGARLGHVGNLTRRKNAVGDNSLTYEHVARALWVVTWLIKLSHRDRVTESLWQVQVISLISDSQCEFSSKNVYYCLRGSNLRIRDDFQRDVFALYLQPQWCSSAVIGHKIIILVTCIYILGNVISTAIVNIRYTGTTCMSFLSTHLSLKLYLTDQHDISTRTNNYDVLCT